MLLIVHGIAGMLLPVVIGMLVDKVVAPSAAGVGFASVTGPLVWWGLALVGVFLVVNLSYRFGGRLGWSSGCSARSSSSPRRRALACVLTRAGWWERRVRRVGCSRSRPVTCTARVSCSTSRCTRRVSIVGLLTAAVILFAIHPWLGLGVVVALPIVVVLMQLAAIPLRRRSIREQAGLADAAAVAADLVAGYRVIRGINAQATAAGRYRTVSREALRGTLAAQFALSRIRRHQHRDRATLRRGCGSRCSDTRVHRAVHDRATCDRRRGRGQPDRTARRTGRHPRHLLGDLAGLRPPRARPTLGARESCRARRTHRRHHPAGRHCRRPAASGSARTPGRIAAEYHRVVRGVRRDRPPPGRATPLPTCSPHRPSP